MRYVGTATGVTGLSYDSDPSGGSMTGAVVRRFTCGAFADKAMCSGDLRVDLCFTCTQGAAEQLCE